MLLSFQCLYPLIRMPLQTSETVINVVFLHTYCICLYIYFVCVFQQLWTSDNADDAGDQEDPQQ